MTTETIDGKDSTTAAETRRVALALFAAMEDIAAMDALIAPDATIWTPGAGYLNRADFYPIHAPYIARPEPISRSTKLHGLTVDGERAAIEMEWEISWPDVTYHHVLTVRDGKIQAMRLYQDPIEGAKLFSWQK
jgi:ketosteroid isomerase-like protein